jgi:hypothetical protein
MFKSKKKKLKLTKKSVAMKKNKIIANLLLYFLSNDENFKLND